ncbi:hypothetical protein CNQ84_00535 [Pseudomonas abyssi]|uniref:Uncharacterized protein n=1 Tax=Pseudomonas abyssi TaxID=170540 RepID=A0A2A3MM69_9PSED|nr:hypothetical protein [Pseudomonas abyssi]PBK05901.1 hypothetical protein CNQ84_00535 [Pseudomonas abyssi]
MSATDDRRRRLQGNLEGRRSGIQNNLTARQQSMADRLVQTLADNLTERKPPPTLRREEPRGAIAAGRGRVERNYEPERNPGSGGGIASPLEEVNYGSRLYHTNGIPSTDGLFVYPLLSRLLLEDADGAPVEIYLAGTSAPTP